MKNEAQNDLNRLQEMDERVNQYDFTSDVPTSEWLSIDSTFVVKFTSGDEKLIMDDEDDRLRSANDIDPVKVSELVEAGFLEVLEARETTITQVRYQVTVRARQALELGKRQAEIAELEEEIIRLRTKHDNLTGKSEE